MAPGMLCMLRVKLLRSISNGGTSFLFFKQFYKGSI